MALTIVQTCDGCGEAREVSFNSYDFDFSVEDASRNGGWREVRPGKHLCNDCIRTAIGG